MDKNKKPFKPGQLAKIRNHTYRIVKNNKDWLPFNPCIKCVFWNITHRTICERFCMKRYYSKDRPMPENCYFKLVK